MFLTVPTNLDEVFYEYLITISDEEKKEIRDKILSDAAELQYGIDSRNPAVVGHSATDKTYHNYQGDNFLCKECPFFERCLEFRKDSKEISHAEATLLRFKHDMAQPRK